MKLYFKLAWRNLWRNKRRTLITVASVFFGVLLSAYMNSMQEGSYDQYVHSIVHYFSGSIQVHKKGYWDKQSINNTFRIREHMEKKILQIENVDNLFPRLESFALASSDDITKVALILGISPEKEDGFTQISKKIIDGHYLKDGDDGILLGEGLAAYLKLGLGDTLVLLSQGYQGVSAAGIFPVRGILKHPSPSLDRQLVYMDIHTCRNFYTAADLSSSLVIMLNDNNFLDETKATISSLVGDDHEVMTWKEMNPALVQQIQSDRDSGKIMIMILYVLIAFGILGTVTMMMAERKKELGITIAMGMQKGKMAVILLIETILIGIVGVLAGLIISIPLNYYFYLNPLPLTGQAKEAVENMGFEAVMRFSMQPKVFYNQALTVLILTFMIGIYPIIKIYRMKVIKALRD
jgi:ABC-type lipoprotein release transport system permease subunit